MRKSGHSFFVLGAVTAATLIFLLAPVLLVSWASFTGGDVLRIPPNGYSLQWFRKIISEGGWRSGLTNSLAVAIGTALLSTLAALSGALGLLGLEARARRYVAAAFLFPLAFPTIVLAVGQLFAFESMGLGEGKVRLILAHLAVCLPISFLIVYTSIFGPFHRYVKQGLAFTDSRLLIMKRLIFPLMSVQILGAGIIAFLQSFDEPVLTMFLGGPSTETIPRLIFNGLRYELDPSAAAITLLVTAFWLFAAAMTTFGDREGTGK